MFDVVIAGGRVVDGTGLPWFRADVGVAGGRIAAVGDLSRAAAAARIDAAGRVVAPGFIDAHVHGDLALFADPHHEPAIRQGVTTYILGQDGSAMAPASPATLAYMRRYTAGFNGGFETPGLSWRSLDEYLNCLDRRCALNVACLVPNGNVRLEVIGLDPRPATPDELGRMRRLVREAMEQGAVGLSSGLDYIPSRYAHEAELTALCEEIAPFGGVYVTHMRGYTPEKVLPAMEEVANIGRGAGCAVHISHFNSLASQVLPVLDAYRAEGIDMTFDLYCYLAGSTILGMIALPPEVQEGGLEPTLERLRSPEVRQRLPEWFARMRSPVESVRLGWVPAEEYRRFEGKTLGEAAGEAGVSIADFVCDVLIATRMATNCVVPHDLRRTEEDVRGLLRHPAMMAGSDGIYVGGHPHPRGCGCFAHYVGHYARQRGDWSLEQAVSHLSYHAARRFRLH
ncbi:MAG TPA: amidohydrolase family protein, partial [Gemmataceae bacterium]